MDKEKIKEIRLRIKDYGKPETLQDYYKILTKINKLKKLKGKCSKCGKLMKEISNENWSIFCPECFDTMLKSGELKEKIK